MADVDRSDVESWVERYVWAWGTNDPKDVGDLFTEDAKYYTAPYREPWTGRDPIVQGWIDRKDETGTWKFRFEVVGVDGDTGFVRGWTTYTDGDDYSNLWMIRLTPDGRATEFTEWWMEKKQSQQAAAASP
jgi:ketosteroid isomerase-like protein